jgi:hypothetical protein
MTFFCAVYSQDLTLGGKEPTPAGVTLVGQTAVRAAGPRQAAAKGYVRCVGRRRARLLKDVFQAPQTCVENETNWRAIAPGLMRSSNRLGDCYCFDNVLEAWYILVSPAALPLPRRRLSRRSSLSSHSPSPN